MPLSRINTSSIANNTIIAADINANTITGDKMTANSISSNNIISVLGSAITANTVANSAFQTGSVENYLNAGGRPLSNRNLIFNGAMQIAQRNTSVTGITTNDAVLTADRWKITSGSLGTWTMNVESNGPTSTGLRNSANLICTSAQSSPPSSSYLLFKQDMEGQMLQSIKKGTPGAEQVTVSFWTKSSNTGTFIAEMRDGDNNRSVSKSYTIDTANTWEKKTITFPADTTGQLDNDNQRSMELSFWFGSGSDYAGGTLQTTWGTSVGADNTRAAGQLNLANRVGNYIAFTGIQWEIGPVATPFEFRPYSTELALCQRYCYLQSGSTNGNAPMGTSYTYDSTTAFSYIAIPSMRANPTLTTVGNFLINQTNSGGYTARPVSVLSINQGSQTGCSVQATITSGNAGAVGTLAVNADSTAKMIFSAEL
jgi:hypothetical protein